MSYMGAYVLWLEDNGLEGMEHVERYHKENPHMIPNPRQVGQWQDYSDNEEEVVRENLKSIAKAAEVLGWNDK